MDALIMAGQIILALAILVTLHELGHFAAARMFGIKVEKFYLFFDAWGVKLFSFKKGDTEYGIGWLPLGGYVKIAGMIDESMDTEQMKKEPESWEFRSKPAWQRLIVMIAGVTVNFFLGILIFIMSLWYYGDEKLPVNSLTLGMHAQEVGKKIGLRDGDKIIGVNGVKAKYIDELKKPSVFLHTGNYYDVMRHDSLIKVRLPNDIIDQISDKKNSLFEPIVYCVIKDFDDTTLPAYKSGLKIGDTIISLNDTAVVYNHQFRERIANYAGKKITVKAKRNGDTITVHSKASKTGRFGFEVDYYSKDVVPFKYTFAQSIPLGTSRAFEALGDNITGMKRLISGKLDPRKSVQGPIGIATMFGSQWIWERFWGLTALLSLILAFMNLLPIPALDGGHVVFLVVEMILRRPLSDKFMQVMQVIGMVILLSLMVFAFGNDIYKLFTK